MILSEVKKFLGEDWEMLRSKMADSLSSDIDILESTNSDLLSHSGKQLRPVLALLVARACGGKATEDSVSYAAASELLHNATLLHDDVADGSVKRRGRPTVMSLLGPSVSVLIGDFWLVKAMDSIFSASRSSSDVIRIFSKTLGDLAEGEMLQLQKSGTGDTDEKDYLRIIYNKTASLFEATAVSAAISVEADESLVEAMRKYSVALGLAFQIRDDMFDYSAGDDFGKPVGIDLDERKITLPLLGALASVGEEEAREVRDKVIHIHENPVYKEEVRDFVFAHGGMEYSRKVLDSYVSKAIEALSVLPDSREKDYLAELAEFTGKREK